MRLTILLALMLGLGLAGAVGMTPDWHAVRDSLTRIHPRMRSHWLEERGFEDRRPLPAEGQNSTGLRCIGRWSYGPSYDIDGRKTPAETLVAQARGSGVSLIRFRRTDSVELELLADVNAEGLMHRVWVRDSLLYVGSAAGLEIWDIADERSPIRLSWTPIQLNDFCVQESLAYVIGADDSFRVYSVADPESPYQVGVCRDSGYSVAVTGNTALIGDRWGLYVLNVSDPANPHRVHSWGSAIDAIATRGALACVTQYNPNQPGELSLRTFHVSDPPAVIPLGTLSGAGGYDIHLEDTLVFCSGDGDDHSLKVVSIADSSQPRLLGAASSRGWGTGIWANGLNRSAFYAAHFEGMQVFNVVNTANPVWDTSYAAAGSALDIDIRSGLAAVATDLTGLTLLAISDPSQPERLGAYDTAGQRPFMHAALVEDSFAFAGWFVPKFVSLDIVDPAHPRLAGSCLPVANLAEDMALRDTLVYVVEDGALRVINVARPREPEMIGSCGLNGATWDLDVEDTVAYVTSTMFNIVSIEQPDNPRVIGTWNFTQAADVIDTIAYMACRYDIGLRTVNVADPTSPRVLDTLAVDGWFNDIVVVDSLAYAGGDKVRVYNVSDPRNLREVGVWIPPHEVRRLAYAPPYLYAACYDGGICVLESLQVGVSEGGGLSRSEQELAVVPSPARGRVKVKLGREIRSWVVRDVAGRQVCSGTVRSEQHTLELDLSHVAAGVYVLELRTATGEVRGKIVKQW